MTNPDDLVHPHTDLDPGLTKREYFAAMMMSAILGNTTTLANLEKGDANVALFALQQTDALIAELNKETKP